MKAVFTDKNYSKRRDTTLPKCTTQKKIALADGMTIQRRTDLLPKTIANIGKNKALPPF